MRVVTNRKPSLRSRSWIIGWVRMDRITEGLTVQSSVLAARVHPSKATTTIRGT